jgi:hypothetical protein
MSVFDIPEKETGDTVSAQEINDIVAVGKTYKTYIAILTQAGTDAPVATILNSGDYNYLGEILWTRDGAGYYLGYLENGFTAKTAVLFSQINNIGFCYGARVGNSPTESYLELSTWDIAGASADDLIFKSPIEVRVYQ